MFEILVLGATGFIGGHIAKAALQVGWKVRGFRRRAGSTGHLQGNKVEWIEGDLMQPASLKQAMDGVDLVFHAAAYYPQSESQRSLDQHIATAKTEIQHVLEAAHGAAVRRLIYTSSLSTIDLPPADEDRLADERDVYQPGTLSGNAYYEVKSIMERAVHSAVDSGLNAVIVNPTAVFGPGDVHLTTGRILIAAAQGKIPVVPAGTMNFVDVRDVAQGQIAAARKGSTGERYILGGHNLSIPHALRRIAETANASPPLFTIPESVLRGTVSLFNRIPFLSVPDHLQAYTHWQGYNTQKAQEAFDLNPRSFADTIQDSLSWYQNHGMI